MHHSTQIQFVEIIQLEHQIIHTLHHNHIVHFQIIDAVVAANHNGFIFSIDSI